MRLLLTGAGLLVLSFVFTLVLTGQGLGPDQPSPESLAVLSWLGNASLYVGSGLVVVGALLRALQPPAPRADATPFGQTDYWGG